LTALLRAASCGVSTPVGVDTGCGGGGGLPVVGPQPIKSGKTITINPKVIVLTVFMDFPPLSPQTPNPFVTIA
jgi:hypothetical protein